jgi:hypothetical protein
MKRTIILDAPIFLVLVLLTNFSNHDQVINGSEEVVVMLRW